MPSTRAGYELGSGNYHRESRTHRFEYDQEETPASMAVVTALSEVMGVDPIELDPLERTVSVDALDALAYARKTDIGDVEVTLSLEDYTVTVHSYGVVAVSPVESDDTEDIVPA
jgi:hypothetical protein